MSLYTKVKKAYDNYDFSKRLCKACPANIFLQEAIGATTAGGCLPLWKDYTDNFHFSYFMYCCNCQRFALEESKKFCSRKNVKI
jgi:hypothetical protein